MCWDDGANGAPVTDQNKLPHRRMQQAVPGSSSGGAGDTKGRSLCQSNGCTHKSTAVLFYYVSTGHERAHWRAACSRSSPTGPWCSLFSFAPSSLRIRTFGYNCYRLAPVDRTRASCHWQSSLLAHLSILLSSCLAPFFWTTDTCLSIGVG